MHAFLRDLRYGMHLMGTARGFSAVAILALALGIGANTAIFSVVHAVLLRTLPVRDPDSVVAFVNYNQKRNVKSAPVPYADVCDWRRALRSFEGISAWQPGSVNLLAGGEPERVRLGRVNHTFLGMLGVRPVLGRDFLREEDRPGAGRVVMLSHELWKRRFAADPNVAGARVSLDGEPHTVIGVLPPRFRFVGERADMYVPLALAEARGARVLPVSAYGRLKRGVPPAQVEAELDAMTQATVARMPRYQGWRLRTMPIREWIEPDVKASLWVLLAAVGLMLLIACANVASLLVSRAAARRREIAVRAALGAGRWRLVRQLVAENIPLGVLGAGAGLLMAWWAIDLLPGFNLARISRLDETRIDGPVLAFTAAVSFVTCLLFGLAPAVSLSRGDVSEALKEGGRSAGGSLRGSRLRGALVVIEVALALLLAVGATLMMRTFFTLAAVHPGFDPGDLLTASVELPRTQYRTREQVLAFWSTLVERLRALPGAKEACLTNSLPLGGNYFKGTFLVEGQEYRDPHDMPILNFRTVDTGYFRTLHIPLRRGRLFDERDRAGAEPAMIINETTARRYFGRNDPIGRRMGSPGEWMTIVGVMPDVKHTDVSFAADTEVLLPFWQALSTSGTVVVRLDPAIYPDPLRFAPLLRRTVTSLDRNQAVYGVAAMERIMADRLAPRRLNMVLLGVFAAIAITLAAVGIYGLLSFSIERRTHEIGVRMALGARAGDVVLMVVRQALALVLAGVVLGLAATAVLTRLLASILYGVSATDPVIYAGTALLLTAVGVVAAWLPARRATRVDPVAALRCE